MYSNKELYPCWQDFAQNKKVQQTYNLNLATLNIWTMLQKPNSNRPKRKSHIITKELPKYNTGIAAPSEVKFIESGSIKDEMGSTFYWGRKSLTDKSESGVVFAVMNNIQLSTFEDLKPANDKLITLRFLLVNSKYCILIAVYGLTMTNSTPPQKKKKKTKKKNKRKNKKKEAISTISSACNPECWQKQSFLETLTLLLCIFI